MDQPYYGQYADVWRTKLFRSDGRNRPPSGRRAAGERNRGADSGRNTINNRGKRNLNEARKGARKRKRVVSARRKLAFALILAITFLVILFLIYKFFFVASNIVVENTKNYTSEEVIKASGIDERDNLFSFRASAVENRITLLCPYIKSVDLTRTIPNNVRINAVDDSASFYINIYGDLRVMSETLRILGDYDADAEGTSLIRIKLPEIKYAMEGRTIKLFNDKYEYQIRNIIETIMDSNLRDQITSINLTDPYDIYVFCNGKHKLKIGDSTDLELKLRTAYKVLEDEMFKTDNKISVDLTTNGKTIVLIDNSLVID